MDQGSGAGQYGDEIEKLGVWQGSLLNHSAARNGSEPLDWLTSCASLNAFGDTSYFYFSHETHSDGMSVAESNRRRSFALNYLLRSNEALSEAQLAGFREMMSFVKTAHNNGDAQAAAKAQEDYMVGAANAFLGFVPGEGIKNISAPYDSEETFRRLLLDLDADFLLRHLAAEDRAHLDRIAGLWRDLSILAIQNAFWPGGEFQSGRVRALCSEDIRKKLAGLDIELLCSEALTEFAAGRMRVPRWAIESGQRMLVRGQQPIFVAVQSEEDLLRSWRSFLGRRLRRELDNPERPEMESFEAMRETRKTHDHGAHDSCDEDCDDEIGPEDNSGLGAW